MKNTINQLRKHCRSFKTKFRDEELNNINGLFLTTSPYFYKK